MEVKTNENCSKIDRIHSSLDERIDLLHLDDTFIK